MQVNTIDKNFSKFRDHALSADYIDLKKLVLSIRKVEEQIGKFSKEVQFPEKKIIKKVRRSAYAKKNIYSLEKINLDNTIFLRPSVSTNFMHIKKIFGKRINKIIYKTKIIK